MEFGKIRSIETLVFGRECARAITHTWLYKRDFFVSEVFRGEPREECVCSQIWKCVRAAAQKDPPNSYTSIGWLKEKWIWWFGFRPLKHLNSIAFSSTHCERACVCVLFVCAEIFAFSFFIWSASACVCVCVYKIFLLLMLMFLLVSSLFSWTCFRAFLKKELRIALYALFLSFSPAPFLLIDRSLARSFTPSFLLVPQCACVCVCASVRPNADTKYVMHCFQAFEKR